VLHFRKLHACCCNPPTRSARQWTRLRQPRDAGAQPGKARHGIALPTGIDARGRKQYRYHVEWRALKDETKFERLEAFGRALPKIRARVARDLQAGSKAPLDRELVLATLVRLRDTTFLRVGQEIRKQQ
jgi:DNA topoisomerase IB